MSCCTKIACTIACCMTFALQATAETSGFAPPPDPPLAWEETVTPGFDPPIEETLVMHYHAEDAVRAQHAEAWGSDTSLVLMRLHDDPKWSEYRPLIQSYLLLLGGNVPVEELEAQLRVLFDRVSTGNDLDDSEWQLIYRMRHDATENMRVIIRDAFAAADAETQSNMTHHLNHFAGAYRIAYLESCLPLAKSDAAQRNIEQSIESVRAQARADEPMAKIVEAEKTDETNP